MKTKSLLLGLFLISGAGAALGAQVGIFTYESDGKSIMITACTGGRGVVIIPERIAGLPVTGIGLNAFRDLTGLTHVLIPNGVTSIGSAAFFGCLGLTRIVIPESVTGIGAFAFSDCTGLMEFEVHPLNPAYKSVAGVLFDKQGATLVCWPGGKGGSYPIPSGVNAIASGAFLGCTSLTNVTIPEGVTMIGSQAFRGCTNLSAVTIPNTVTGIRNNAFQDCSSLSNVAIPAGVTMIESWAFNGCSGLTSVTIPDTVIHIQEGAFSGCLRLPSIEVAPLNPAYRSQEGVLLEKSGKKLVQWPGGKVGSHKIPDGVTEIERFALGGFAGPTSITIPGSVTKIGLYAFSGCTGLTSVTIPDSVTEIGRWAFSGCTDLASVRIPDSVTSLGLRAFQGCTGLTGVTIGKGITAIEDSTFDGCARLTNIVVPDTVTSIWSSAFSGCAGLTNVTIGKGVGVLGYYSFAHCTGLTSIKLPDVTRVAGEAFSWCRGLTNIEVSTQHQIYSGLEGALLNKAGTTFVMCPPGKTGAYAIPDSVTRIETGAFSGCLGLTSVKLPKDVTRIGDWMLRHCFGLTHIEVHPQNSAYSSHEGVLFNKSGTVLILFPPGRAGSYTVPDSVVRIEASAFSECLSVTSVMMPSSVTSVGDQAFYFCRELGAVYFSGDSPWGEGSLFLGCPETLRVYYRPGTQRWGPSFWSVPTAPWISPRILSQPGHVVWHEGRGGSVEVELLAIPPEECQWYFNSVPIEGATNARLERPAVTAIHQGLYTLVATNGLGAVTSHPVVVMVSNVDPLVLPTLTWSSDPRNPMTLQTAESILGPWTDLLDYPPHDGGQVHVETDLTRPACFYRVKGVSPAVFTAIGRANSWWFHQPVGSRHRIEYTGASSGWTNWQFLTNLSLPYSPYLFADQASQQQLERVYRVSPAP